MKTPKPKLPKLTEIPKETRAELKKFERAIAEQSVAAMGLDTPAPFKLTLAGVETCFEFGARAYYRMGTADRPFDLTDCSNPKRAHSATVTWLWACLSRDDAERFPEPEDLAEVLPLTCMLEVTKLFIAAITTYNATRRATSGQPVEAAAAAQPRP